MKPLKTGCNTEKCMMCTLCMKEWHAAIKSNRKNFKAAKGEFLFREGEKVTGMYFVYEGLVKVHKQWDEEKELIIRFAGPGDIFGHRGLGKDNRFPISATAIEDSIVCFVEIDFFLATLKVNGSLLFHLMMFYASELQESERNMRNLAHMPVKGRIAQNLLTLQEKFGITNDGSININISRQDLASYAGTSYETLFRMMNELAEENTISVDGKKVIIRNENILKKYAGLLP